MSQITEPRETGGPAFPCDVFDGKKHTTAAGMSLRDYFAAKAMAGWLASYGSDNPHPATTGHAEVVAANAYAMADAMLKASQS